jgi:NhaP-type Na+/H+ and K+/H+ antiporter
MLTLLILLLVILNGQMRTERSRTEHHARDRTFLATFGNFRLPTDPK